MSLTHSQMAAGFCAATVIVGVVLLAVELLPTRGGSSGSGSPGPQGGRAAATVAAPRVLPGISPVERNRRAGARSTRLRSG